MASINKAIIVGNIGRDPDTRYMADGSAVTNIAVATTDKWKDKGTGEQKENTEWHRITFYGKLAEIAGQYLKKGSQVYVEGKLKTRKWTDKDGVEKYTTEIVADTMQMLGARQGNNDDDGYGAPQQRTQQQRPAQSQRPAANQRQQRPAPNFSDMDDEIPF